MYRLKQITLLLGDLLSLYLGLFLAILIRHQSWPKQVLVQLISPMSILFCLAVVLIFIAGLYDIDRAKNNKKFYHKIILVATLWIIIGVIYFYINNYNKISPKTILLLTAGAGFGLMSGWRYCYNRFVSTTIWQANIIFAGYTAEVKELINLLTREPQRGYLVKGIITDEQLNLKETNIVTGRNMAEINDKLKINNVNLIVLSPHRQGDLVLLKELYDHLFKEINIINLASFYEELTGRIPPFTFSESWFITNLQEQTKKIYDRAKLIIDYLFALLMVLVFILTWPIIALIIKSTSTGPIFFRQKRVGRLGKIFTVYKYRTMQALSADGSAEINGPQFASDDDQRITRIGKILRRTRLDELPQFINIFRREMSIIGPRPERPEFVAQITAQMPFYSLRHLIRPGLTGWAQIKHGYSSTLDENLRKLEYDLFYIKNRGPLLDLGIILRTINIVTRLAGK